MWHHKNHRIILTVIEMIRIYYVKVRRFYILLEWKSGASCRWSVIFTSFSYFYINNTNQSLEFLCVRLQKKNLPFSVLTRVRVLSEKFFSFWSEDSYLYVYKRQSHPIKKYFVFALIFTPDNADFQYTAIRFLY